MIPDPIQAVIDYLIDDSDINNLVNGKVYGFRLPQIEAVNMPQACIVIQPAGSGFSGDSDSSELSNMRIDAFCYGRTEQEAMQLRLIVRERFKRLQRQVVGNTLLHSAIKTAGPFYIPDGDGQWPCINDMYMVISSEIAV